MVSCGQAVKIHFPQKKTTTTKLELKPDDSEGGWRAGVWCCDFAYLYGQLLNFFKQFTSFYSSYYCLGQHYVVVVLLPRCRHQHCFVLLLFFFFAFVAVAPSPSFAIGSLVFHSFCLVMAAIQQPAAVAAAAATVMGKEEE